MSCPVRLWRLILASHSRLSPSQVPFTLCPSLHLFHIAFQYLNSSEDLCTCIGLWGCLPIFFLPGIISDVRGSLWLFKSVHLSLAIYILGLRWWILCTFPLNTLQAAFSKSKEMLSHSQLLPIPHVSLYIHSPDQSSRVARSTAELLSSLFSLP